MMNCVSSSDGLFARLLYKVQSLVTLLRPFSTASALSALPHVLVVVEGQNDIEFLRRISVILHRKDSTVPNLTNLEQQLNLVFVPTGGGDLSSAYRFAGLKLPEFHLLDRDIPPATEARQRVAAIVNSRAKCQAVV
jgi:hypothetical protein